MDVNAVKYGAGNQLLVFGNDSRRAPTDLMWFTKIAAWAWIHSSNLGIIEALNDYFRESKHASPFTTRRVDRTVLFEPNWVDQLPYSEV
jgi:hypothetical protein